MNIGVNIGVNICDFGPSREYWRQYWRQYLQLGVKVANIGVNIGVNIYLRCPFKATILTCLRNCPNCLGLYLDVYIKKCLYIVVV